MFDAESVLRLLCHYTDGAVPLDSVLKSAGVSAVFGRWIGLNVESKEWSGEEVLGGGLAPLHVRYEGKKVMSWEGKGMEPEWTEGVEAPKRT